MTMASYTSYIYMTYVLYQTIIHTLIATPEQSQGSPLKPTIYLPISYIFDGRVLT